MQTAEYLRKINALAQALRMCADVCKQASDEEIVEMLAVQARAEQSALIFMAPVDVPEARANIDQHKDIIQLVCQLREWRKTYRGEDE